jgi:hypothetical protein
LDQTGSGETETYWNYLKIPKKIPADDGEVVVVVVVVVEKAGWGSSGWSPLGWSPSSW